MTPPPLLPFLFVKKSSGKPIIFPVDKKPVMVFFRIRQPIRLIGILVLPIQSNMIVSSSVHAGEAAYNGEGTTRYYTATLVQ